MQRDADNKQSGPPEKLQIAVRLGQCKLPAARWNTDHATDSQHAGQQKTTACSQQKRCAKNWCDLREWHLVMTAPMGSVLFCACKYRLCWRMVFRVQYGQIRRKAI
jgi:hypothetical protein